MVFTLSIIISFLSLNHQDNTDSQKWERQIDGYIDNIENQINPAKNYWALVETIYSSDNTTAYAFSAIQNLSIGNSYLDALKDNIDFNKPADTLRSALLKNGALATNSFNLAIAYLATEEGNIDKGFYNDFILSESLSNKKRELLRKVIDRERLNINDIDLTEDAFIHFLLLFNEPRVTYYSNDLLEEASKAWRNNISSNDTFEKICSFKVEYDLNKYSITSQVYQSLISDSFFPNSFYRLRLLSMLEYSLNQIGGYHLANEIIKEYSLPLTKHLGATTQRSSILRRYGANLYNLGKYHEAKEVYIELTKNLDFRDAAVALNDLGITYNRLGDASKQLSSLTRAIEIAKQDTTSDGAAALLTIYQNLHIYHRASKNWNTALSYLEEAKKIAESNLDNYQPGPIYRAYGNFYWDFQKDFSKALESIDEGLSIIDKENNYRNYTELLSIKGSLFKENNRIKEAKELFKEIGELAFSNSNISGYLEAQIELASIALLEKEIEVAVEIFESINKYELTELDFIFIVQLNTAQSQYASITGKQNFAIRNLSHVVDQVIERSKNNTDNQAGYWSIETQYLDAFEVMIDLLISSQQNLDAVQLLDRIKTINDANFYSNPLIAGNKLTEQELYKEQELDSELQSLRRKLLSSKGSNRTQIQSQIDQKTAERQLLLAKVDSKAQEKNTPIWLLQRRLGYDQVMVHITEINDFFYKATITRKDITIEKLPFGEEERALYERASIALAEKETDLNDLHAIYKHLNLEALPKNKSQVLLVPDSYLYRIPLDILPTHVPNSATSYGSAHYLLEDKLITMYSSIQEYFHNSRKRSADFDVAFNAYGISNFDNVTTKELVSLPGAIREVNKLENSLPYFDSKKIFTEEQATKEMFKTTIGSSRVVHVATHSEVSEQDPLYSTIYLKSNGSDSTDDGTLYAYELYNLNINSDLIVLNSCSSGSGDYLQGTGVLGITRALRYAGARSLVLNLWSVNDNVASRFAQDFYAELGKGLSKPEALRNAKLKQIETGSADPHYWGVYMFIGNPSQLTEKPSSSSAGMYSFLGLILALSIYLGYTQTQDRGRRRAA